MFRLPYLTSPNTPAPHIAYGDEGGQGSYTDIWKMYDGDPNTYGRSASPEGQFRSRFYRTTSSTGEPPGWGPDAPRVMEWSFIRYAVTVRADGINTPKFWVFALYHPVHGDDYKEVWFSDGFGGAMTVENWWIADIQQKLTWSPGQRKVFDLVEPMPLAQEVVFEFHYGNAVSFGWWSGDQWGLNIVDIASIELYARSPVGDVWVYKTGEWRPIADIWAQKGGAWQLVTNHWKHKGGEWK